MSEFKPILFSLFILFFICSCSTAYNTNSSSEEVSSESETSSKPKADTTINDTKSNTTNHLNSLEKSSLDDYSTNSEKVKSHGEGEYDDSGQGIFGRRIIKIPDLRSLVDTATGKVVVKICINPRGNVVYTELVNQETTIKDIDLIKETLEVAKKYKYEKDFDAPKEQCGKFVFKFYGANESNSNYDEQALESESISNLKEDITIVDRKSNTNNHLNSLEKSSLDDYSTNSEKVKSHGEGEYDDSGQGIFGRRVIDIPNLASLMNNSVTGKIVVKMCVNPRGDVVYTELVRRETTITNEYKIREALKVAKKYKFEKDIDAPKEQCGKFVFKITRTYDNNSNYEEQALETESTSYPKADITINDTKSNTNNHFNSLDKSSLDDSSINSKKVKSLGDGEYDDSGQGIFGRRIIEIPNLGPLLKGRLTGNIVVKMCVNPQGDVVFSELVKEETTITDKRMIKDALQIAKKYKYEKDRDAPELQCGRFIFKLDVE